jgi:hypothetical protein
MNGNDSRRFEYQGGEISATSRKRNEELGASRNVRGRERAQLCTNGWARCIPLCGGAAIRSVSASGSFSPMRRHDSAAPRLRPAHRLAIARSASVGTGPRTRGPRRRTTRETIRTARPSGAVLLLPTTIALERSRAWVKPPARSPTTPLPSSSILVTCSGTSIVPRRA